MTQIAFAPSTDRKYAPLVCGHCTTRSPVPDNLFLLRRCSNCQSTNTQYAKPPKERQKPACGAAWTLKTGLH